MKRKPVNAPRVSVVMPVYNRAAYVAEAIESVLAKTDRRTKIVVVDDGSTDESIDVVQRFADGQIRVVRQENLGIGAARNRGLAVVTGDAVAFIDSDDLLEREKLALQLDALRRSEDVQLVFGHLVEFLSPSVPPSSDRSASRPIPYPSRATTLLLRRSAIDRIGSTRPTCDISHAD